MRRHPPLQNRVTPEGEIIATPARGTMMGNRGGCLHTLDRQLGHRRWVSRQWICCSLAFNGRQRRVMAPGRYTELFFLDEATALAAGHRPCFECRRAEAQRFAKLWALAHGTRDAPARAADMDRILQEQRVGAVGTKRTHRASLADLPDGTFIRLATGPAVIVGQWLLAWTPAGYTHRVTCDGEAEVLTPPGIIAVMKSGYTPVMHETVQVLR